MKIFHKKVDITEYILSASWEGSNSEVARKLEIKVVNAPDDPNIKAVIIDLADMLYLYDDEDNELFRGYVISREHTSEIGSVSYVAYDMLYYTLKSNATYNLKGKTADGITKTICEDMQIPIGSLATTDVIKNFIVSDLSIYEIIMRAYTKAYKKNHIKYRVTAQEGKLNVIEMGKVSCDISLSDKTNIESSSYQQSIENVVNKVKIYDAKGDFIKAKENTPSVKKYGIFQIIYTPDDNDYTDETISNMYKDVDDDMTFSLECIGDVKAVTGAEVRVTDSVLGIKRKFWIDEDTHNWENGIHTMSLTLKKKRLMDVKEE